MTSRAQSPITIIVCLLHNALHSAHQHDVHAQVLYCVAVYDDTLTVAANAATAAADVKQPQSNSSSTLMQPSAQSTAANSLPN
jgi:methylglyoxal synthase